VMVVADAPTTTQSDNATLEASKTRARTGGCYRHPRHSGISTSSTSSSSSREIVGSALQPTPGPMRENEADRNIVGRAGVPRERYRRGPREVVVEDPAERGVVGHPDIGQSLIEAEDRPPIHLLVLAIPAVELHHPGLVAVGIAVGRRSPKRLGPVRSQPFGVFGMKAMTKGVANHLIIQHPGMPCRSELTKALGATCSLVDASHVLTMTYPSAGYKAAS
jgi:hypothetical protein